MVKVGIWLNRIKDERVISITTMWQLHLGFSILLDKTFKQERIMSIQFKPDGYTSVAPYLIVNGVGQTL